MGKRHSLVHRIEDWADKKPNSKALHGKKGGAWQSLTWKGYWTAVRETAKGFIALGHQPGECIAIVGNNRVDWVIAQFGIMAARGVPAPIYTSNTVDQASYIVDHSKAKIAVCDNQEQLDKYQAGIEQGLCKIEEIVAMDELSGDNVTTLSALRKQGAEQDDAELDKRLGELKDDELALLIYTSGTTSVPKAVMLEHGGMIEVAESVLSYFPVLKEENNYRSVSYLPLCHVAEQLFTNFLHLSTGGEVSFCPDIKELKSYLNDVRPTLFLGVPRVWEQFQAALEAKMGEATGIRAKLAAWALRTELDHFRRSAERGEYVNSFSRMLANKLVISKVKNALGLDKLKVASTGAAPISLGTLEFFASSGITVYEGYGMSETAGVAACGEYGRPLLGSVGRALPGVEIKIADDGEILLKGRIMTKGYLHMEQQTKDLYAYNDEWLCTDDLGELDEKGFLKITGRKKDLIITSGGKNVAPAEMEAYMKQIMGVGQAVVVGDQQPYLTALITLDPEAVLELSNRLGISNRDLEQFVKEEKLHKYLIDEIESQCNAKVARYQTIKKFEILPEEFSVDTGELTPTMKIKRNIVRDKYKDQISSMYA